ncbi:MAG: NAD kinase [Methylophilaceae bacterium]
MKIALYARHLAQEHLPVTGNLLDELKRLDCSIFIYQPLLHQLRIAGMEPPGSKPFHSGSEIRGEVDFLLSIGGDGTILDTLTMVQDSGIPVLGINVGRLGFLTGVGKDEITAALEALQKGHYSIDKRSLLRLESNRNLFGGLNYALNELTIHKKDSSSMIIINTFLNGEYLNSYWADGLIIATPTGSTGYSMSCGGPIVAPHSGNFVITPIAPHNLSVRPIVVSDKNVISLEVEGRNQYFLASLDSRSVTIDTAISLAVRKEEFSMNLVRLGSANFLDTLRKKLNWGLDTRN